MSIRDKIASILSPSNGKVSVEGNFNEDAPMHKMLGGNIFKRLVIGSFIGAVMMSSVGNAFASPVPSPTDIIHPPAGVSITTDHSRGNYFKSSDGQNNIVNLSSDSQQHVIGEYSGSLNLNYDYKSKVFVNAGVSSEAIDGADVSDFQGLAEQSQLIRNFIDVRMTPLHMTRAEMHKAEIHMDNAFRYTLNDYDYFNSLDSKTQDVVIGKIINLIHKDVNATKLFDAGISVDNALKVEMSGSKLVKNATEYSVVKQLAQSEDDRNETLAYYTDFDTMRDGLSSKNMVEQARTAGFNEIYSNIGNHYNLTADNVHQLFNMGVTVHEYTHLIDNAHQLSKESENIASNNEKIHNFNFSYQKEALADLSAMPIAAAVYSKECGQDPAKLTGALLDSFLLLRSSTLKGTTVDGHIGAADSVLYWSQHRDQLAELATKISSDLPTNVKDINFSRDIAPNVDSIYHKIFLSSDFQEVSSELHGNVDRNNIEEETTNSANVKYRLHYELSNLPYKILFDASNNNVSVDTDTGGMGM